MATQSVGQSVTTNPVVMLARMEVALVEGWTRMAFASIKQMSHLCAFPGMPSVCGTQRRWHDVMPQGADLISKYGHRPHDVDAERAV